MINVRQWLEDILSDITLEDDVEEEDQEEEEGEKQMNTIHLRFKGEGPMLMNSERGVNYLDDLVKKKKAITSRKKKTEEDLEKVAKLEWEIALYYEPPPVTKDKDGKDLPKDKIEKKEWWGPYIPGQNVEASIRDGAKFEKRGRDVERGVSVPEEKIRLEYKGPRELEKLWSKEFRDIRSVKQQTARIMKCRPKFEKWAIEFALDYDSSLFNESDIIRICQLGGKYARLGDFRRKFGRYNVEQIEYDDEGKEKGKTHGK